MNININTNENNDRIGNKFNSYNPFSQSKQPYEPHYLLNSEVNTPNLFESDCFINYGRSTDTNTINDKDG